MKYKRLFLRLNDQQLIDCIRRYHSENQETLIQTLYRQLIRRITEDARQIGYRCMLLDTLPVLEDAVRLYRQLGFYEIPCYNDSPVESTLFFQLDL